MSEQDYTALIEKARFIAENIRHDAQQELNFLILSHFDADGLAAAGIAAKALLRLNTSFHVKVVKQLDQDILEFAFKSSYDKIIFVELGSGHLDQIKEYHNEERIYIIDHHPVVGDSEFLTNHLNPNLYGYDGATDLSGSGIIYLTAREITNQNIDLSPLAVVGALGDMQDKNEKRALIGLNDEIVKDGKKSGLIDVETDLVFYGRETRQIAKAIANTTNPYLPNLSGREDNCVALLSAANIPLKEGERWKTLADLTNEEKQQLISKIVEFLIDQGFSGDIARTLIGEVYIFTKEKRGTVFRDAREYSSTLNACGRLDKYGLGLALCLGNRDTAVNEVETLILEYKQTLAKYMTWITENKESIQTRTSIVVIRGENHINENMSGAISSMLSSSNTFDPNKALIVVTKPKDQEIKISARISRILLEKGVHLGEILNNISPSYDGVGGGHNVAAGAKISSNKLDLFLNELENKISEQIDQ
jgi:RecJ-like exonuclease